MTASRDPDRLIRAYLADGPTELPRRSYEAVDDLIERTRQRAVVGPWRDPRMSILARAVIGAAAVIVAAVIGVNVLRGPTSSPPGSAGATPSPTSSPSPSVLASPSEPTAYTWPTDLPAGTYRTSLRWDPSLVFNFTVPAGWQSRDVNLRKGVRASLMFYPVENVVTDVCTHTLTPNFHRSVPEVVQALQKVLTVQVGRADLKIGDRTATEVTFDAGPAVGCSPSEYAFIALPVGICGTGCGGLGPNWIGLEFAGGREHNRIWLMDVGRKAIAIAEVWTDDATAADLAELQAIRDSVRLDTPLATPEPQPAAS